MPLASKNLEVLSKNDLSRVHDASIRILQETGIIFHSEEVRDIFKSHGARVEGKIVYIPEKMVESALETCPSTFKHWARNESHSMLIGMKQKKLAVSTQNGPVYVEDIDQGRRPGKIEDYVKITKLCQESSVVNVVGGIPVEPIDVDPESRHLQIMYHLLKHTDKAIYGITGTQQQVREMFDMLEIAFGQQDYLLEHPAIGVAVNPLSPLCYDEGPCETILAYAKHGQPVYINTAAMAGVTGPISLLGIATLLNTEVLAGIVLMQLINPGCPAVYTAGSTVANMRNANCIYGSPEANLINIAALQMARDLYHIPTRSMAGLSDSKLVDCQAGYETMQNIMMLVMAGVNIINETVGTLDSIMTTSYEKFIIDEELVKRVIRIMEGMDTSDKELSVEAIQEVAHGGSYLMHPDTLANYKQRWQPTVSEWGTYDEWQESGSEDVVVKANRIYREVLHNSPLSLLDEEVEQDLQTYFHKKYPSHSITKGN